MSKMIICRNCKYYVRAAISHKIGDLGLAMINAKRHACLNPDMDIVVVFAWGDVGYGSCEYFKEVSSDK